MCPILKTRLSPAVLNKNIIAWLIVLLCFVAFTSCKKQERKQLPILGQRSVVGSDTVYHTIAQFEFIDQDSATITNETFKDKIYVADFFFTSCRTICPIMKTQLLRIYEATENTPEILILSHTIDPEHDTVALLRDFAARLGVESSRWHFVTGARDSIYHIAQTSYFATAMEDRGEPDGFVHSGAFMLIDKKGRIRGKYDGTRPAETDRLMVDLNILRQEL